MQRMGMVIGIKPEKISTYRDLHAQAWPQVLAKMTEGNIRNFSIFLHEAECLLFGYWEYHGSDLEKDMALVAADLKTQEWWALTDECQRPLPGRAESEHWAMMKEVFYHA